MNRAVGSEEMTGGGMDAAKPYKRTKAFLTAYRHLGCNSGNIIILADVHTFIIGSTSSSIYSVRIIVSFSDEDGMCRAAGNVFLLDHGTLINNAIHISCLRRIINSVP